MRAIPVKLKASDSILQEENLQSENLINSWKRAEKEGRKMKPCYMLPQYLTVKRNSGNKKSEKRQKIPPKLVVSIISISTSGLEIFSVTEKGRSSETGQVI